MEMFTLHRKTKIAKNKSLATKKAFFNIRKASFNTVNSRYNHIAGPNINCDNNEL